LIAGIALKPALVLSYIGGMASLLVGGGEAFGVLIIVTLLNLGVWV
jgi:hypothetical protein